MYNNIQFLSTLRNEEALMPSLLKCSTGKGTTNNGNTAQRFFQDPKSVARITGLHEDLIHHFAVLLATINSGEAVNVDEFKRYALETANLYMKHYSWYKLSAHVHKLLLHGGDIIENSLLPMWKQ